MARFRADEVSHYGGQGGTGYFSLKNDRDVATVRFMYDNIDELEGYAVHQVEIEGRKRYVNCLRNYNDPIDKCPFCREKMFQTAKFFIPVYSLERDDKGELKAEGKVQVWERGKKFASQMSGLMARYSSPNTPFCAQLFEIERQGEKGSTTTQYGIYPVGQPDNTTMDDLPELPNILGGVVLDKSAEDMEVFLETGNFPSDNAQGVRRRTERTSEQSNSYERENSRPAYNDRRTERRTPTRRGGNF